MKIPENGKISWTLGYLGFVLYSAQLPFFLGVLPGKEGRMDLEVSKSHSRRVASRQLISKHQLTFLFIHLHCMACTKKELNQGYVFTSTAASFHQSTLASLMSSHMALACFSQHIIKKLGRK